MKMLLLWPWINQGYRAACSFWGIMNKTLFLQGF